MTYAITIKGNSNEVDLSRVLYERKLDGRRLGEFVFGRVDDEKEGTHGLRTLREEVVVELFRELNGRCVGFDVYPNIPRLSLMQVKDK